MKSTKPYIFAIIFTAIFFKMNSAAAGERVRVFEMGDLVTALDEATQRSPDIR